MDKQKDWNLIVPTLSIHPDMATRDDIARLAAELMEANRRIEEMINIIHRYENPETFTRSEIIHAIEQFLEFGENAFKEKYQSGYFSGTGWAARCLRFHLSQIKKEEGK